MNATFSPRTLRYLIAVLFGLLCVPLFAATAFGAEAPVLQANIVWEFASDRGRMIQISLVFVALGCALIWWYR